MRSAISDTPFSRAVETMTQIMSTSSQASRISMQVIMTGPVWPPCAVISTGFCGEACGGISGRIFFCTSSDSAGTTRPADENMSAAIAPPPPEPVTMPTRRPFGSGQDAITAAMAQASSRSLASITP